MTDNGVIVWEDPPERLNTPGKWVQTLAPLIDHPGKWARVHLGPNAASIVSRLRLQKLQAPPGRWEFQASGDKVFARYLGPEAAQLES
jgi:hypothetical protein